MGEHKNLSDRDAITKIQELAKGETAMLCTQATTGELHSRPMHTQAVDDDGTIWFFSDRDSLKNFEIQNDSVVHLIYAIGGKAEYLTINGLATVTRDQQKIDELWSRLAKAWFTDGKQDPDLTLISVSPTDGYYWESKHGKVVQLAKIAVGAVLGKPYDDGVSGKLRVGDNPRA